MIRTRLFGLALLALVAAWPCLRHPARSRQAPSGARSKARGRRPASARRCRHRRGVRPAHSSCPARSSITGGAGLSRGFRGEAIGYDNGAGVLVGHCVWTDERGDRVYSQLRSETVATGRLVTGTVVGGTGRYAGLTGEFTFEWQYVVEGEGGAFSGRTTGLRGRVRGGTGQ